MQFVLKATFRHAARYKVLAVQHPNSKTGEGFGFL